MGEIDRSGQFYLGKTFDLETGEAANTPVFYPARHLTTHAIILGMTGSGKTGLGMILLEEALLQGVPILAIDPKGDLTNLLLTFPNLAPEDFAPWIDVEQAERDGVPIDQAAAKEAEKWRNGLARWEIGPERIARLRQAADMRLFTPGSTAATPVDVLHRLHAPDLDWGTHAEVLRNDIADLVTALLGLVGRQADPLQSPEHIFMSHLVEHVWRAGQDLTLPDLIRAVQDPPIRQVGVFDLESFMPAKERAGLARALNNIFAAPGFAMWREGVPLDVRRLLYDDGGRPRASIFYLPHLGETERMFFVTLLLGAVREWMSTRSGTSDLRVMLYFDEVFGFFPPHPANPPSKEPLMALIKQGRAAGLGVVLSTQNPADLDYKGLTNAGTWVVGTLRTQRDKDRVLEGLEGASSSAGAPLKRADLDRALGALKPRVFLLHNIRADGSDFFQTRWAMSYLRGPLTRTQVQQLAAQGAALTPAPARAAAPAQPQSAPAPPGSTAPPTLPAGVPQVFVPAAVTAEWALRQHEQRTGQKVQLRSAQLTHIPRLLGAATVYLNDERKGVSHQEAVTRLIDPPPPPAPVDWERGEVRIVMSNLAHAPVGEGAYQPPPAHLATPSAYTGWSRALADHLYRQVRVSVWHNPALKLYAQAGESERDFRARCETEMRKQRDAEIEKEKEKADREIERVNTRLRSEQRKLDDLRSRHSARQREEALGGAETLINLVSGRRASSALTSASRRRQVTQQAGSSVREAQDRLDDLKKQLESLQTRWKEKRDEIARRWDEALQGIQQVEIAPRRQDVVVDYCGLAWVPVWEIETETGQRLSLPAHEAEER